MRVRSLALNYIDTEFMQNVRSVERDVDVMEKLDVPGSKVTRSRFEARQCRGINASPTTKTRSCGSLSREMKATAFVEAFSLSLSLGFVVSRATWRQNFSDFFATLRQRC